MRRWFVGVCFWLLAVLPSVAQTPAPNQAVLRFGHFSIDAGAVDVYLDDVLYLENIASGSVSAWRNLAVGTHTLTITRNRSPRTSPLVIPFTFEVPAGEWLTMTVIGRLTDGTLSLHPLIEDYRPLLAGETRLSFFNAFFNNPPLNISANGIELVRLLAYPNTLAAGNDGLETRTVLAGTYNIAINLVDGSRMSDITGVPLGKNRHYLITLMGTIDNPRPIIVGTDLAAPLGSAGAISTPIVNPTATPAAQIIEATPTFTATALVTSAAVNTPDDDATATVVPTEATAAVLPSPSPTFAPSIAGDGRALVRMGNFSPGAPAFDLYLNSQLWEAEVDYPELGEYQSVDAGTYEISVVVAGETLSNAVLRQRVQFVADNVNAVLLIGSLDTGTFALQSVVEDYRPLETGLARVGIFHAVPDAPFINVVANNRELWVERLAYPGVFERAGDGFFSLDVVARNYDLSVEINDGVPLHLGQVRMGAGRYYFIVIAGTSETAFFVLDAVNVNEIKPNR